MPDDVDGAVGALLVAAGVALSVVAVGVVPGALAAPFVVAEHPDAIKQIAMDTIVESICFIACS